MVGRIDLVSSKSNLSVTVDVNRVGMQASVETPMLGQDLQGHSDRDRDVYRALGVHRFVREIAEGGPVGPVADYGEHSLVLDGRSGSDAC